MAKATPAFEPYSLQPVTGDDLIGRDADKQELQRLLSGRAKVIILTGERGIGKTSLLMTIPSLVENMEWIPQYNAATGGEFWETLGAQLAGLLHAAKRLGTWRFDGLIPIADLLGLPPVPSLPAKLFTIERTGAAEPDFTRFLKVCAKLKTRRKPVCIRVESAHLMKPTDHVWLMELCRESGNLFVILEAPSNELDKLDGSVRKAASELPLGRLSEKAARELVQRGKFLEDGAVKRIVKLGEGSPYYLQNVCWVLWQRHNSGRSDEIPHIIEHLDARDLTDKLKVVHGEVVGSLGRPAAQLAQDLAIVPAAFTDAIARQFTGLKAKDYAGALQELLDRCIAVQEGETMHLYHGRFREHLRDVQHLTAAEVGKRYLKAARALTADPPVELVLLEVYDDAPLLNELVRVVTHPNALSKLASRLYVNGRTAEALATWQRLLDLAGTDKVWRSAALGNIGLIFSDKGEPNKALKYLEEALAILREIGHQQGVASALGNIGNIFSDKGESDKALKHLEEALAIDREIGYQQGVAAHLGDIGLIFIGKGESDKALKYFEEALAIDREIGYQLGVANHLGNIGSIYIGKGEPDTALKYLEEALAIHREIGYQQGVANGLGNVGRIYIDKGEPDKALRYLEEALAIGREIGHQQGVANGLGDIGTIYRDKGEPDKALKYLEEALAIDRETGHQQGVAAHLGDIGLIYRDKGELD
ncbi:MAG: tetratricopeptide repeat protein, partial [candidate division WOR-3 bacterium]|nr:tetratricopeptide repeat protein [candidate division WOR-3 bacterium]